MASSHPQRQKWDLRVSTDYNEQLSVDPKSKHMKCQLLVVMPQTAAFYITIP